MKQFIRNNSGAVFLILAAAIWGTAFVAQTSAAESVESFTFNASRYLLAAAALGVAIGLKYKKSKPEKAQQKISGKKLFIYGAAIGCVLFIASSLQQFGISVYPDNVSNVPGRSGFLTAMYVVLVPLSAVFFKKKISLQVWIAVVLSVIALWLICLENGFEGIYLGDLLMILCAICFSAHIILIDSVSFKADGLKLSCIQFLTAGTLSLICALIFDNTPIENVAKAWLPILYVGIGSSAIGYTFQIIGQKKTAPAVASILMSLESVFALLGGMAIFSQMPSLREGIGCAVMFAAVILSQIKSTSKEGSQ